MNARNVGAQLAESPWPTFRGNLQRTGLSPYDTGHVDGTIKWSFRAGDSVVSSPAIGPDGTIYFGVSMPARSAPNFFALNPDGTLKWSSRLGGVISSAAIDKDGTVYVGSFDGQLYAFGGSDEGSVVSYVKTGPIDKIIAAFLDFF